MTTVILLALLLALVQIWLLPMLLNLKNANFLLSNRDNPPEATPVLARIQRASVNLQTFFFLILSFFFSGYNL